MTSVTSRLPYADTHTETRTAFVLGHRPELDGLRGVSILLVLALHLRLREMTGFGLPGGFLGVDIFFVLSGFLITALLVQEFDRTGAISLKGFYLRRALRLVPALVVLIPLACLFAIFAGLQRDETLQGAWLTLSYVSNWLYAFDYASPRNPLGITWSLAIEEQFYFAWPLLFALALKFRIKHGAVLCALLSIVGLIAIHRYSLTMSGAGLPRVYYATDTRADGLLIGCVTGLLLSWGFVPRSKLAVATLRLLALLGTFLLIGLALTTPSTAVILYIGGFTIVALAIAAILSTLMLYPPQFALSALRCAPLVWIGKVSYGLYLWHWVVLKFIFPKDGPPSIGQFMLGISLSFLFTALSFYLVEKPFLRLKDRITDYGKLKP